MNAPFTVACYPWQAYVLGKACIATALLQNGWIVQDELQAMGETDLKAALIMHLNKHLDSEIHSIPELSYRLFISIFSTKIQYIFVEKSLIKKVVSVA